MVAMNTYYDTGGKAKYKKLSEERCISLRKVSRCKKNIPTDLVWLGHSKLINETIKLSGLILSVIIQYIYYMSIIPYRITCSQLISLLRDLKCS